MHNHLHYWCWYGAEANTQEVSRTRLPAPGLCVASHNLTPALPQTATTLVKVIALHWSSSRPSLSNISETQVTILKIL